MRERHGGRFRRTALAPLLILGLFFAAGCGGEADEEPAGGGARALDVEAVAVRREGLPAGFPADLPIYDGKITSSGKHDGERSVYYRVKLTTPDAPGTVLKWYNAELAKAGYVIDDMSDVFGDFGSMLPESVAFHKEMPRGILSGSVTPEASGEGAIITIEADIQLVK